MLLRAGLSEIDNEHQLSRRWWDMFNVVKGGS